MYDTIAAISTGPATGAIGIVRLSGAGAVAAAGRLFRADNGRALTDAPARHMTGGALCDLSGRVLDRILAVVFRAPESYTGEDMVELHCHGALPVLREALRTLYELGVRPARPGEFTKRAFLRGRMDLAQAEAVIDLITAQTADAARNAAGQIGGAISREIEAVYALATHLCAQFRAEVDFPDEDVPPLPLAEAAASLRAAAGRLTALADTYERGRILREGVRCAIIGRPNVGKSSLLNALLGFDRAIVTDRPGTTRDTLEESVHLGGLWLRVSDTAGLREASDEIERLGVARARLAAQSAQLLFLVLDGSLPITDEDRAVMDQARGLPAIVVVNKSDLPERIEMDVLEAAFLHICRVCAVSGDGLTQLDSLVRRLFDAGAPPCDGGLLTNARHAEAVARAADALASAADALAGGVTPDIVLTELEAGLDALGEITGRRISEDIIHRVFERFCVGK
ncbi:MAG: tRNA uridine-5-carboxymethylaminomethyl(34) synthesis GTPase MnmE [Oscillospiraceae bacterium]|jgi:tRNA modification GTPase|nr:tRNA uridine-5-carboxymethylaminomethyl(34) synthesis GTPase MnmE [Oscillospiraceae bacterium]